jgi:anthranilate phosphoribosyltransferase
LEYAGAHLHSSPEILGKILEESGFCFLFAQSFHPGLRQIASLRKELGIRTIFNALGPLINPSRPGGMVVGVYERRLGPIMIEALKLTGVKKAIVVHGANGLDEVRS